MTDIKWESELLVQREKGSLAFSVDEFCSYVSFLTIPMAFLDAYSKSSFGN